MEVHNDPKPSRCNDWVDRYNGYINNLVWLGDKDSADCKQTAPGMRQQTTHGGAGTVAGEAGGTEDGALTLDSLFTRPYTTFTPLHSPPTFPTTHPIAILTLSYPILHSQPSPQPSLLTISHPTLTTLSPTLTSHHIPSYTHNPLLLNPQLSTQHLSPHHTSILKQVTNIPPPTLTTPSTSTLRTLISMISSMFVDAKANPLLDYEGSPRLLPLHPLTPLPPILTPHPMYPP
ncbi:hypothetical protein Pmani_025504 [Petrolisthes manimaculis]|uniref:Uncharacterized protein n=1 Tax=Petrolisthes manimaculis TaxID=1843537 RepID=A0AAE1P829_9EUCA|nr:hypothetical protein Pmani_025504 [Petrolisthes manimaculis]